MNEDEAPADLIEALDALAAMEPGQARNERVRIYQSGTVFRNGSYVRVDDGWFASVGSYAIEASRPTRRAAVRALATVVLRKKSIEVAGTSVALEILRLSLRETG